MSFMSFIYVIVLVFFVFVSFLFMYFLINYVFICLFIYLFIIIVLPLFMSGAMQVHLLQSSNQLAKILPKKLIRYSKRINIDIIQRLQEYTFRWSWIENKNVLSKVEHET